MSGRTCQKCWKILTGRQTIWCSAYCMNHVIVVCPGCNQSFDKSKNNRTCYCASCVQSGDRNHAWRGGHEYWQEGKYGRDKDGLSWKKQRELARERDKHSCVDCGKTREEMGHEPHCDHEIPYRISHSHALTNLKCRCPSCHKKVEATRIELWNGKTFGGKPPAKIKHSCSDCKNSRRKLNTQGRCDPCQRVNHDIPQARKLREEGWSLQKIADYLKVTNPCVSAWLLGKTYSSI